MWQGHKNDFDLVRYLQLLIHTEVWIHYALLTSLQFGAERRRILKEDLDGFPIIPWEKLSDEQQLANGTGASMAIIETNTPRTCFIGILNHARYWTPSRARLCAIRILREGMQPFEE